MSRKEENRIDEAGKNKRYGRISVYYIALVMGLALATGSGLNSVRGQDQPVLQHDVSVVLKLIQVYVTDDHGKPVTDLNKEDFTIFDQGNPIEITAFERHVLGETKPAEQTILGRKFILFFDFAFTTSDSLDEARKAALYFIDHEVRPYDELALLSYSSIEFLKLHEYLTTDHGKVRKAVENLGLSGILGRAENVERLILETREDMEKDAKLQKKRGCLRFPSPPFPRIWAKRNPTAKLNLIR
jgi:VWFA-related protein